MSEKFSADWWEKFRASSLSEEANSLQASSQTESVEEIIAAAVKGRTDRTRTCKRSALPG
jgi:hypothetical protein